MRLLVTNTRGTQANSIIWCLRPEAEQIVATTSGPRPFGLWPTDNAAYSRLVDCRFQVPNPEIDWFEGRVQRENTKHEERFMSAILKICQRERIDTIFPSYDPWVYIFSKNKSAFEQRGITIPVPDYETVAIPLDKYRTIRSAEEIGFPCPRTYLAENENEVKRAARELKPPWLLKLRFTSGGRGQEIVQDRQELLEKVQALQKRHGPPMIQEYIPGSESLNASFVLDRDGRLLSAFMPKVLRHSAHAHRTRPAASESMAPTPFVERMLELVRYIGWWGGVTVQCKVDCRDNSPKLMEINPRLGTYLWQRVILGVNEPLLCLKVARGEPVDPVIDYSTGCLLLAPLEDALGLPFELFDLAAYRFRTKILKQSTLDPALAPMTLKDRFVSYWDHYFSKRKRLFNLHFRNLLTDPLPSLIWCSKLIYVYAGLIRRGHIGQ